MRIWDNEYKVAGRALGISLRLVVTAPIVFKLRFWAESARDKISRYKRGETFSVFLKITCQDFFADCPKDSLCTAEGWSLQTLSPGFHSSWLCFTFCQWRGLGTGRGGGGGSADRLEGRGEAASSFRNEMKQKKSCIAHFFLQLNHIPLSGCTIVYLSTYWLKDIFIASKFWQSWESCSKHSCEGFVWM